jgi:hypothetical protein
MTMSRSIGRRPTCLNVVCWHSARITAAALVVIGMLLAGGMSNPAAAAPQSPHGRPVNTAGASHCPDVVPARAFVGPLAPTPSDALTQTLTVQPAPRLCCHCPEGVFGAIWEADGAVREQLGSIWSASPHHPLVAFETDIAYQSFEHGAMVWAGIGVYGDPRVHVFYPDGTFQAFQDTFDAAKDPTGGGEQPPTGFYEPVLGFGKVWREQPGVRDAVGWATSEETYGKGRDQMFEHGIMMWIGQRQETYVLMGDEPFSSQGNYVVIPSPTFDLPAPAPRDAAALIVGVWRDRYLDTEQLSTPVELVFSADGGLTFQGCTGTYYWSEGNRVEIRWDGCATPDPPEGPYEVAFGSGGQAMTLSQRFAEEMPLTGGGDVWSHTNLGYELWWEGESLRVPDFCEGRIGYLDNCEIQLAWSDCPMDFSPLGATRYQYTIAGESLTLTREFERVR